MLWLPLLLYAPWHDRRWQTLVALLLLQGALVILVGGDGLYRARLLAQVMPLGALAVAAGFAELGRQQPRWRVPTIVLLAVAQVAPLSSGHFFRGYSVGQVREWESRWTEVGRALRRVATPCGLLATNVAGRVPYYSELPTLDVLGLTDPVIAHSEVSDWGKGYAGHERANPDYVLARKPDVLYFSVLDGLPLAAFADWQTAARVLGSGSLHRYQQLFRRALFVRQYRPATLALPSGEHANLYVRRGTACEQAVVDSPLRTQ